MRLLSKKFTKNIRLKWLFLADPFLKSGRPFQGPAHFLLFTTFRQIAGAGKQTKDTIAYFDLGAAKQASRSNCIACQALQRFAKSPCVSFTPCHPSESDMSPTATNLLFWRRRFNFGRDLTETNNSCSIRQSGSLKINHISIGVFKLFLAFIIMFEYLLFSNN